jgi:membrane protein DedA with SNARE-associated domain
MKKNLKKPHKGNPFRWLALTGFGAQLGLTIYGSIRLGQWLDHHYHTDRTLTLVSVLLGLLVAIVVVLRQLKTLDHE